MQPFLTEAKDKPKALALLRAVMDGNMASVRRLSDAGAETALQRGEVYKEALLFDGANARMFDLLNLHPFDTPANACLYFAAYRGDIAMVDYFLERGDYCQTSLNAALYGAVAAGSLPLVKTFLALGADAGCGDGSCLAESITAKQDAITACLRAATSGNAAAAATVMLEAYIRTGELDTAQELLDAGASPLAGLKAVCRAVNDRNSLRDTRMDAQTLAVADTILGFAARRGDDMPLLLHHAMTMAVDQWSLPMMEKIVDRPEFLRLPNLQGHLDDGLSCAGYLASRVGPGRAAAYGSLALRLLDKGADPQGALLCGVDTRALPLVEAALKAGADPRCDNYLARRQAILGAEGGAPAAVDILSRVLAAEADLDLRDYAALLQKAGAEGLTVGRLRETDAATGRSGLMVAFAAGAGASALGAFKKEGVALTPEDLAHRDGDGMSVLRLLSDRRQEEQLLDRELWRGRESDYARVFDSLSAAAQQKLADRDADLRAGLKVDRDMQTLKDRAKRFRLG